MRIAVRHTDESHPNGQWFAFGQGRILGFTDPRDGSSVSADELADLMMKQAKRQFPESEGYEHRLERLVVAGTDEDGNDIGKWVPADEGSNLPEAAAGATSEQSLAVQQGQEESSR